MARKVKKGFLFDQNFCIGCGACVVACQVYHKQEEHVNWRFVDSFLTLDEKNREREVRVSRACNHCEDPACLKVCPTYAFSVREDGIVELDREKCISCGACEEACPYGAITRAGEDQLAQKCNMCAERQDRGEETACVRACPMEVLKIVDINVADASDMHKEIPGFKRDETVKPKVRFYPKFTQRRTVIEEIIINKG